MFEVGIGARRSTVHASVYTVKISKLTFYSSLR